MSINRGTVFASATAALLALSLPAVAQTGTTQSGTTQSGTSQPATGQTGQAAETGGTGQEVAPTTPLVGTGTDNSGSGATGGDTVGSGDGASSDIAPTTPLVGTGTADTVGGSGSGAGSASGGITGNATGGELGGATGTGAMTGRAGTGSGNATTGRAGSATAAQSGGGDASGGTGTGDVRKFETPDMVSQGDTDGSNSDRSAADTGDAARSAQSGDMRRPSDSMDRGMGSDPRSQDGATIMLDIEGFTQEIYERGYRQGYLRGIADARQRIMREMDDRRSQMRDERERQRQAARGGERGSIIMLPPGMSPEAFIDRLMQENERMQGGSGSN